jgi:hypothetical protein
MLTLDPTERLTINQIAADPQIKFHITDWVNSTGFQVFWRESKENIVILNDMTKKIFCAALHKEAGDDKLDLDKAYHEYVNNQAELTVIQVPSKQVIVNRDQMYRKYKKKRIMALDFFANITWEATAVADGK